MKYCFIILVSLVLAIFLGTKTSSAAYFPRKHRLAVLPIHCPRDGFKAGNFWSNLLHKHLKEQVSIPVISIKKVTRALKRKKKFAFTFTANEWKSFGKGLGVSHFIDGDVRFVNGSRSQEIHLLIRCRRAGRDKPLFERSRAAAFTEDPTDAFSWCCKTLIREMSQSMRSLLGPPPPQKIQIRKLKLPLPRNKALDDSPLRKAPSSPRAIKKSRISGKYTSLLSRPRATVGITQWKAASKTIGSLPFKESTDMRSGVVFPVGKDRMSLDFVSSSSRAEQSGEAFALDLDFLELTYEKHFGSSGLYLGIGASYISGELHYSLGSSTLSRKANTIVPRFIAGLSFGNRKGMQVDLQIPVTVGEIDFGTSGGASYELDLFRPNMALRLATSF